MTNSTNTTQQNQKRNAGRALGAGLILVVLLALGLSTFIVQATNHQLSIAGYADFSYEILGADPEDQLDDPTGKGAESKVWWNDNYWWAVMYNRTGQAHHIYQLDASQQRWLDTGVEVDARENSRADVLWDGSKLYVASHIKTDNANYNNNPDNAARLYRYTYDDANDTYTLDQNFPVNIASYQTESLVLDKDSTGRLWITFVARDGREGMNPPSRVRINYSGDNDLDWNPSDPFVPAIGNTNVISDDISSLVAFSDNSGSKIGVMWSNQSDNQFYFAVHPDNADPEAGWILDPGFATALPASFPADDHINFAPQQGGPLFAVVKTNNMPDPPAPEPARTTIIEADEDPLISVLARNAAGVWSHIPVSPAASLDTRPVAVVNDSTDELYVFTVSKPTQPSQVCVHTASIVTPLSTMSFDADNCEPPAGEPAASLASLLELTAAPSFIGDTTTYTTINSPSTVKGSIGNDSGVVVLASDQPNLFYVHNHGFNTYVQPTLTPVPGTPTSTATAMSTATATPTATTTTVPPTVTVTVPPIFPENIHLPIIIDDLD